MQKRYEVVRYLSMIILWAVLVFTVIVFSLENGTLPDLMVLIALISLIGIQALNLIFQRPVGALVADQHSQAVGKRKNNPDSLSDPMSLLTDDDIEALRAELRESLRDRIRRLSADESETFEELLSDSKRKRGDHR